MESDLPPAAAAPAERIPLHTRQVTYRAFARADGLWDVEGTLRDTKAVHIDRFDIRPLEPGDDAHHMHVRVTVDDHLRIVSVASGMETVPFGECHQARAPLQRLVGRTLGPGWRRVLNDTMGGVAGCTHLRELLLNLATAAIQGIGAYRDQRRREQGLPELSSSDAPPHFVGGCMTWDPAGPAVARYFPRFSRPAAAGREDDAGEAALPT